MSDESQDRIKLNLSIDFDIDSQYKDMIIPIMEEVIGNLSFSSSGNGTIKPGSTYSYKLISNIPPQPMTLEKMFEIMDAHREPGEPSMEERITESMREDYEQIEQWWDKLNDLQKQWFRENYKGITLISQAYDIYQKYEPKEKAVFDRL